MKSFKNIVVPTSDRLKRKNRLRCLISCIAILLLFLTTGCGPSSRYIVLESHFQVSTEMTFYIVSNERYDIQRMIRENLSERGFATYSVLDLQSIQRNITSQSDYNHENKHYFVDFTYTDPVRNYPHLHALALRFFDVESTKLVGEASGIAYFSEHSYFTTAELVNALIEQIFDESQSFSIRQSEVGATTENIPPAELSKIRPRTIVILSSIVATIVALGVILLK